MGLQQVKRTRNLYLVVSTIALAVFGLIYAWSIFATPLSTEFGWDRGALQSTFNIVLICFCIAQLVGGIVVGKLGSRNTLLLAGVLALVGFGGTALFADISLWGIYVSYGVLGGFGGKKYARNLGLVNLSAALASFFGIGMVALSSPDGASTNLSVWVAFTIVAALALACCIAFYIVYRKPAQE